MSPDTPKQNRRLLTSEEASAAIEKKYDYIVGSIVNRYRVRPDVAKDIVHGGIRDFLQRNVYRRYRGQSDFTTFVIGYLRYAVKENRQNDFRWDDERKKLKKHLEAEDVGPPKRRKAKPSLCQCLICGEPLRWVSELRKGHMECLRRGREQGMKRFVGPLGTYRPPPPPKPVNQLVLTAAIRIERWQAADYLKWLERQRAQQDLGHYAGSTVGWGAPYIKTPRKSTPRKRRGGARVDSSYGQSDWLTLWDGETEDHWAHSRRPRDERHDWARRKRDGLENRLAARADVRRAVVAKVDPETRNVMFLHHVAGHSFSAIAETKHPRPSTKALIAKVERAQQDLKNGKPLPLEAYRPVLRRQRAGLARASDIRSPEENHRRPATVVGTAHGS